MRQRRRISCGSVSGECIFLTVEKSVSRANSGNPSATGNEAFSYLTDTSRPILYLFPVEGEMCSRAHPKLQPRTTACSSPKTKRNPASHASQKYVCLQPIYFYAAANNYHVQTMQSEQCSRCLYICSARTPIAETWIMRKIWTYKQSRGRM